MTIKKIVPILKVHNMEEAITFYCNVLGFKSVFQYSTKENGPHYAGVNMDDEYLHLSTFPGDGSSGSVIYLHVDDVDILSKQFQENGLENDNLEPVNQDWGQREIYVNDPYGNQLRFGSSIGNAG